MNFIAIKKIMGILASFASILGFCFAIYISIANQQHQTYENAKSNLSHKNQAVREDSVEFLYTLATKDKRDAQEIWDVLNNHVKTRTGDESYKANPPNEPADDIQLILNIQSSKEQINQRNYPFRNMIINWESAWLEGANLTGAWLQKAHLSNTRLQKAQLHGANLHNAQLLGANLHNAELLGANLHNAQLQEADLRGAQLLGANLHNAQLQEANLRGAQLLGANLHNAQLLGADLRSAQLQGAYLSEAVLPVQSYFLERTNLYGAFSLRDTYEDVITLSDKNKKTWFETVISARVLEGTEVDLVIFGQSRRYGKIRGVNIARSHPGYPNSIYDYLERREVRYGAYTDTQAHEWIKKYNEAVESKIQSKNRPERTQLTQ